MIRKNIYAIHRTLSLLIAIPVLLWAASGFMHPLMTNIKPKVTTQFLQPIPVDTSKVSFSLQDALSKNNLEEIHAFRLVHIDTNWFYQIQTKPNEVPVYLSCQSGKELVNGDELYAQYLGNQFLNGQQSYPNINIIKNNNSSAHDCCDAAKSFVIKRSGQNNINKVTHLTTFDSEYKSVNCLLPVYKINFSREDSIRIYVETTSDRFAYAVDDRRAFLDKIFSWFHSWSWMDATGNFKYLLMSVILGLTFATTLIGVYIFFITKSKKSRGNTLLRARRNHRWVSVAVSIFTLMFSFSGAFHALKKMKKENRSDYFIRHKVDADRLNLDLSRLQKIAGPNIHNVGVVRISQDLYWQVFTVNPKEQIDKKNGQEKNLQVLYVNTINYSILEDGEKKYARMLALEFSKNDTAQISSTDLITKFDGEYGFINKRLPVWKIGFNKNSNERYYVETNTSKLSARIDDSDLYEGYSFAFLHKHHFMDFTGKSGRDISTLFWALGQIVMVTLGLILWLKSSRV